VKFFWDINIHYDNVIEARRPVIAVVDKREFKGIVTDIAVLDDVGVGKRESGKVQMYQEFKRMVEAQVCGSSSMGKFCLFKELLKVSPETLKDGFKNW